MDARCTACIALVACISVCISALNVPSDVVLLLDSSDDFRSSFFETESQFAIDIIQDVFGSSTRIGLYTFGRTAHMQFNLNHYTDIAQIREAVSHMWYSTGNGNLEDAIDYTVDNAFTESAGDRECVPNILLVLTHKTVADPSLLTSIENQLSEKIIRVIVVNMADNKTISDFIQLSGDPTRVISISELSSLNKEVTTIVSKIGSDLPRSGCGELTLWSDWTGCSTACNFGQKFRTRECVKEHTADKDCDGFLTDDETCLKATCAVDGGWSFWGSWGGCTKSCEKGTQKRVRTCTQPEPFSGGKPCEGSTSDTRDCNDWPCPDCAKTCPLGGYLSADCQVCECASVTLFGQIMDDTNSTLEGAEIYVMSRLNEPITITDVLGKFRVDGICVMNEHILVKDISHVDLQVSPVEVNITHWTFNAIIEKHVAPVFNVEPENKIRMVGQSFSLCCSAVGHPQPTTYKWYHNGIELSNQGTLGTLLFSSAAKENVGTYKCSTETDAGISQSKEAVIDIKDNSVDTCGSPSEKLTQLPTGCFETGDSTKSQVIDVGTCENSACITSSIKDNGTCSDWWFHHCCDVRDTEIITIICEDFTYKTTRVSSCQCKLCIFRTTVSGRAIGKENDTEVPLQLGTVYLDNVEIARTNMAGFFNFEVPKGKTRLVVTFHDGFRNKLLDVSKIIQIVEGIDNRVTIVLPVKPKPVSFDSQTGTEFQLGTGIEDERPLGSIEIQKDSVVTFDGEPYKGTAAAVMHFVDPRDRDSLDTANGEFVSEAQDGSPLPLETFGLFKLGVFDDSGNELKINKKMRVSFDTSVLNVTLNENGEPDLAIWDFDINKGIWVEQAKFSFGKSSDRRKLLSNTIEAEFDPSSIKPIKITEEVEVGREQVQVGWTTWNKNIDQRRPIYEWQPVKEEQVKKGVCYVSVSVFEDLSLKERYTGSATVTLYTREKDKSKYIGQSSRPAMNGRACIETFCDKLLYLSVKDAQGVNLYPGNHSLPIGYQHGNGLQDQEISFMSIDRGNSYRCPDPSLLCHGPMYQYRSRSDCNSLNVKSKSFQFKFAPFTRAPSMAYALGSTNIYDRLLSWYPVPPDSVTFRSCFMKVLIKIEGAYDLRLVAKSLLHSFDGDEFGTVDIGPITSPKSRNDTVRAACFEFRCPGYVRNGSHEYFNLSTAVEVHLMTSEPKRCSLRVRNNLQGVSSITNTTRGDTGFKFTAPTGNNYGPFYGIFIYDKPAAEVEPICNSGTDSGLELSGEMNPTRNPAVEFDCLN